METQREPHSISLKAFGSAYVGEPFSCTLCANNELSDSSNRRISAVSIGAEIQAPTQTIPLDLVLADQIDQTELGSGESLQKIIRFDLKEEGNHVLAVSLKYTETLTDDERESRERVRTFRKLYQFVAAPCLSVRTKVSDLPQRGFGNEKRSGTNPMSFALEAQLENMADSPITLVKVSCSPKLSFDITSITWDVSRPGTEKMERPFLMPRDVTQAAFLIKQKPNSTVEMTKDGRVILGQLIIRWRSLMGDPGSLTTGWLTTRRRP
ncbi:MAG: hypothetical protein Q9225_006469 [Loekoesia sp. 1 TL-2023]